MNIPIILAGGVGSRVGADRPKQFIDIYGKPVLVYTIEAFQNHPEIDAIEVVCIKSHIDYLKELVEKYNLTKVKWICEGGKDFQHSVINGVNNLKGEISDDDMVFSASLPLPCPSTLSASATLFLAAALTFRHFFAQLCPRLPYHRVFP